VRLASKMIRCVAILASVFLALANAHHVLFVHSFGTKSHLILMKPLIEELLEKDHQVTSIFFNTIKIDHTNYTEIVVPSKMDDFYASMSKRVSSGGGNVMNPSFWLWMYNFYQENMKVMALDALSDEVMELIKAKPKIEAVISFMPANAIFADIFDCPLINFSPVGPIILFMTGSGNVVNHSVQPWWVEYVCRHGGADWLKSIGEDVPFYQYHHLDIILILTVAALISLTGTFLFWRTVFRCLCGKKTKID